MFLLSRCWEVFVQVFVVGDVLLVSVIGRLILEVFSMFLFFGIMLISGMDRMLIILFVVSMFLVFVCFVLQWVIRRCFGICLFCLVIIVLVFRSLIIWLQLCMEDIFGLEMMMVLLVWCIVSVVLCLILVGLLQMI